MTPLLSNYKKRKVKDKRNKEIKVIIAKTAYNRFTTYSYHLEPFSNSYC